MLQQCKKDPETSRKVKSMWVVVLYAASQPKHGTGSALQAWPQEVRPESRFCIKSIQRHSGDILTIYKIDPKM